MPLLLVLLALGACRSSGGAVDDFGRFVQGLSAKAGDAADNGAVVLGRQVPASPLLSQQAVARTDAVALTHLTGFDPGTAQRIVARACLIRDNAVSLIEAAVEPARAVELAAEVAVGQLELGPEQKARELAKALAEANSTLETVDLLVNAAFCG